MRQASGADRKDDAIVLTGVGMATPVGHDSLSSFAAIRAGISRLQEIPGFLTPSGGQVAGGLAYGLTDERSGSDRLIALAAPAAKEALFRAEEIGEALEASSTRVILCVGAAERPTYEPFGPEDIASLLEAAEAESFAGQVEIVAEGHAGAIRAVHKAGEMLQRGEAKACIVGAFDSLVEYPCLKWLEESGRLKSDERPGGMMPGEAAAFLVLETRAEAARRGASILAQVSAPCVTMEDAHLLSRKPSRGDGLAEAIRTTLASSATPVHGILCDLNGEYFRAKEWSLVMPRVFEGYARVPDLWHPAENIGDVGSASAAVGVALAVGARGAGCFPGPDILVWASSDAGTRGSLLVRGSSHA